jgi:phosphoribosylformimino-5-aminoimidazole carboxamide ribotide isomerase
MARPSAAQDGGIGEPTMPPPVTHSWTRIVGVRREVITPVSFRVIPVIDLKGGMAVHAVGSRRDQYRPLRSIWQASVSPIELAAALRDGLGIDGLYLADLDAIEGRPPAFETLERLAAERLHLWLDAGVRGPLTLEPLLNLAPDRVQIVVGLESVAGPATLAEIMRRVGPDRAIFSLDLDEGRPRIASGASWSSDEPLEIASQAVGLGVRRLILLDLARVGTDGGIGTEDLLIQLRARHPAVSVCVGGGIRGIDDVLRMKERGASAVLVGSAIHAGRIGRRELERIATRAGKRV